ncbi:dTDP-4-amino-4,6-dideoxygalactose transaminase [Photobacterium leiognathi]|uniref:dTDP-4-amino-4,6-dideoxygalactose transaminase n=1 Tax=Photobacterium leiognathi TaxID=553611 RepID=UPI002981F03D|nr:dTDP-4-amino-4,6-dideoxygalactose transaminase [Photobacterium leiognathi]
MIPFNKPPVTGNEIEYIQQVLASEKMCGDGFFGKKCQSWFENEFSCKKTLLTPSCTHALELAALLIDINPGDEIIMPSFTFVSTANAFVLRGAKIVFVDIRADTMNIDEGLIESAITDRTKAIVPVHYAGVACEMDEIMRIAHKYSLYVIEDAAQGVMATYKGRALGTIGHLGTFSFHETKNYTSGGEGGLLLINDDVFVDRAEILREKGTNRSKYLLGTVDKYSWVDLGSSMLPSELQASYLFSQLKCAKSINNKRLECWNIYYEQLESLSHDGLIQLPSIPYGCSHNAHMFYVKVKDIKVRTSLIEHLKNDNIQAAFHYVPLHDSIAGKKYSVFNGEDKYTTRESDRLVRLPLWYGLSIKEISLITDSIKEFYS